MARPLGIGRFFSSSIKVILTQTQTQTQTHGPRLENVVGRGLLTNYTPNRTLKITAKGVVIGVDKDAKKARSKRPSLKQDGSLRTSDESSLFTTSPKSNNRNKKSTKIEITTGRSRLGESPYWENSYLSQSLRPGPAPNTKWPSSSRHQKHHRIDAFKDPAAFDENKAFLDQLFNKIDNLKVPDSQGKTSSKLDDASRKKRQGSDHDTFILSDDDFTSYLTRKQAAEKKATEEEKLEELIKNLEIDRWEKEIHAKMDNGGRREKSSGKKCVDYVETTDEKMKNSKKTTAAESRVPNNTSRVSRNQTAVDDLGTAEVRTPGQGSFKPVSSKSPKIPDPILVIKPDEISNRLKSTKIDQPARQPQPSLPIQVNRRTTGVLLMDQGYAYQDMPSTSQAKHSSARNQQQSLQNDKEVLSKRLGADNDQRIQKMKIPPKEEPKPARKSASTPSMKTFKTAQEKRAEKKMKEVKKNEAALKSTSSPARIAFEKSLGIPVSVSSPQIENKPNDKNSTEKDGRVTEVEESRCGNGLEQESKRALLESSTNHLEITREYWKKKLTEEVTKILREIMKNEKLESRRNLPEQLSQNIYDKWSVETPNDTEKTAGAAFDKSCEETVSSKLGKSVKSRRTGDEVLSRRVTSQSQINESSGARSSRSISSTDKGSKHSSNVGGVAEGEPREGLMFDEWVKGMKQVDMSATRPANRGDFEEDDDNSYAQQLSKQRKNKDVKVGRILDRVCMTNREVTPSVELLSTPGLSKKEKKKLMSILEKSDVLVSMTLEPVEETTEKEMFLRKANQSMSFGANSAATKQSPANQRRVLTEQRLSANQKTFKELQLQRYIAAFERYQERMDREKEERRRKRMAKKLKKKQSF